MLTFNERQHLCVLIFDLKNPAGFYYKNANISICAIITLKNMVSG